MASSALLPRSLFERRKCLLAISAVVLNLLLLALMGLVQSWESRTGRISKRKGYNARKPEESLLYIQDFPTVKWGDTIGLSLVDLGVVVLLAHASLPRPEVVLSSIGVAVFITLGYHLFCMHRLPYYDSMYPAFRTISWTGKIHLLYMVFQLALVSLGFWLLGLTLLGKIEWLLPIILGIAVALFGGAWYMTTSLLNVIILKRFFWRKT